MDDVLRSQLRELERFGTDNDAQASERHEKMLNITPDTGELLGILIQAMNARRVLEIGTSNGYSTLWLADAARAISGTVVTVELSQTKADMARDNIEHAGLSEWVRQEVTEAGEFLSQQPPEQYDLILLDSDRKKYVAWWPLIQKVIAPGGMLVVDNALFPAGEMDDFVALVQATQGWRSVVVPIGKGELVAYKLGSKTENECRLS